MKKFLALLFAVVLCVGMVSCNTVDDPNKEKETTPTDAITDDANKKSEGVMTWEEYSAAELEAAVVIEAYVQGNQTWWDEDGDGTGLITLYAQDPTGGYFIYELPCTKEDADKMTAGTKIKVSGYKAAWAGEVEIIDATFEILEGTWVADVLDVTDLLGKDELINHQNKKVAFKGMTVESIAYKNEQQGNDIYVTLSKDGAKYDFCVESYLTDANTDVYKAVEALTAGDVIDIEGFLYWYEGVNTHITAVKDAQ